MFQSIGLFAQVPCPRDDNCKLISCIFNHESPQQRAEVTQNLNGVPASATKKHREGKGVELPAKKKQKLSPEVETEAITKNTVTPSVATSAVASSSTSTKPSASTSLKSMQRRISPPPTKAEVTKASEKKLIIGKASDKMPETLNPRKIAKPPADHALRTRLLRLIHEQMKRLNNEFKATPGASDSVLLLAPHQLIKLALDEEEREAKSNVSIYSNVMKMRITKLKKMNMQGWLEERNAQLSKHRSMVTANQWESKRADTGLSQPEELAMMMKLVTPQDGLSKHGYVTSQIKDEDIEEARQGVEAAHGYETCDRCGTRFQVFPGRREDGVLATGGTCTYHFGRLRQRTNTSTDQRWTCCQATAGSTGCETAEHHVFKVSDPKRLALVLPFESTETVGPRIPTKAICFDCEMGYTALGMELIRLTALDCQSGKELVDVLVRPMGEILDLNSRFSGVWPDDFANALPYERSRQESNAYSSTKKPRIAKSPEAARAILLEHVTTTTPLVGHALENDLNAARIIHPTIIDTVLLFPHPRKLPYRNGLKMLTKNHLDIDIQMAGAQGHDSKEDARAAGELVRFEIGRKWKSMSLSGWKVADGEFIPPRNS